MYNLINRKIAVVTDSTCDLSNEQIKENNIYLLPLKIVFSDRQYLDRLEIQPEEVYARMEQETPKTSMPSPGETLELFHKLANEGFTDIISIHVSSGLSGTYQMVQGVAEQMKGIINIKVIDSLSVSVGTGFMVLEAQRLLNEGVDFHEVIEKIYQLRSKVKVFFVVKTLEYLRKGGRIGYVSGAIGEILSVKPVIGVNEEGKYYSYKNVRGRKNSLNKLVELVLEGAENKKIKLAVMHGQALEEAKTVAEKLQKPNIDLLRFDSIGPTIVVHAGPGVVGIGFHEEENN